VILIDAYKLHQQFWEHLGQLGTTQVTEVVKITDEYGTPVHVPQPREMLAFENKHDMATKLINALENAIIEAETTEV